MTTIKTEMKRRLDLVENSEFRNLVVSLLPQLGITAKQWNADRKLQTMVYLQVANEYCKIENAHNTENTF